MSANGIVWVASYPKSGNTWMRSFLSVYKSAEGRLNLSELGIPLSANRAILDDLLGINTADLTPTEVRDMLPRAFIAWADAAGNSRIVKTHDAFGYTLSGEYVFPEAATRGVVHVVRDPRDIAVSLMHHNGITLDRAIERLNDTQAWLSRGDREMVDQVPQLISDWSTHLQSWIGAPLPRLTLRYEDILVGPASCFRQVLDFIGLEVDEMRLRQTLEKTSFGSLQALEREGGFNERRASATAPFFRQGRAGAWQNVLTPEQVDRIVSRHAALMKQFGYLE